MLSNDIFNYSISMENNLYYHSCSISSAIWNLSNNRLEAKLRAERSNTGDNLLVYSDHISPEWKGIQFVSLTSNPKYVIAKQYNKNFVRFVLDAEKINKDYNTIDWEFFKSRAYLDKNPDVKKLRKKFGNHDTLEYEKRIKGSLLNLKNYIVRIDIFISNNDDMNQINELVKISNLNNIQVNKIRIRMRDRLPNTGYRFIK